MHTQRQLLERAKAQTESKSYSELADTLGITRQLLSQYRLGAPMSDTAAQRVAELTGYQLEYVLACIEYQRASRLERTTTLQAWARIAEHFRADTSAEHKALATARSAPRARPKP